MVKQVERIIYFGALLYALVCFTDGFFIPVSFALELDNYLFPFGFLNLLIVLGKYKKTRFFFLSFILVFLWSAAVDYVKLDKISISNLLHLFYFIKWPTLMSVFEISFLTSNRSFNIHKVMDILFLSSMGLCILMMVNPFGIGEYLQNIFAPKEYINFIYYNFPGTYRLAGVFLNANDNALFIAAFILYYLFYRTKREWYFIVLAISMFFVTQSRTVFLGLLLLLFLFLAIKYFKGKIVVTGRLKGLILVSFLILILIFSTSRNLQSLFTGQAFQSNSIMTRFENFENFKGNTKINQWLGQGVVSNPVEEIGFYIDSEVVSVLIQFGFVGFLLWGIIFLSVLFLTKKHHLNYFLACYFTLILIASLTNYTLLGGHSGIIISFFTAVHFFLNREKLMSQ